jgi:hypothetical protein
VLFPRQEYYECKIVWLRDPDAMPYVRQSSVQRPARRGRVSLYSRDFTVVGWSELGPDAPRFCGAFWRRVFWLKPYDRYFEPHGTYAADEPAEAVSPRDVQVGRAMLWSP